MLSHEVTDPQVFFFDFSSFSGLLSPGGAFSKLRRVPLLSRVTLVVGQMASYFVTDEAFAVPHMLCSFTRREIDFVHIHGIRVPGRLSGSGGLSWGNVAVSPTPEFPESYHVLVKLSCLVEPLFPFPASFFLSIREGSRGHHDSELVGYPTLESVHEDTVNVDSTACLGQLESSGVFVEVPIKLIHVKGVDGLTSSIFDVFQDEGFFEGIT